MIIQNIPVEPMLQKVGQRPFKYLVFFLMNIQLIAFLILLFLNWRDMSDVNYILMK